MAISKDRLAAAIDEVLEPAWRQERRRAWRRILCRCVLRWTLAMAVIAGVAAIGLVVTGASVPWYFFVLVGVLAAVCAMPASAEVEHLRR